MPRRTAPRFPHTRLIIRLPLVLALALAATAGVLVATDGAAHASSAGAFVSDTNSARNSHGLSSLSVASDLTSIAQRHAQAMANSGTLYHNSSLASDVCCWRSVGENVGEGSSESQVENAFMNSAPHRDNILSSSYTQIGVGTATDSHGTLWVDEVFRQPMGSSGATHISTHRSTTTHHYYTSSAPVRRVTHPAVRRPNVAALLVARLHVAAADRGHPGDPVAAAVGFTRVMAQLQH